MAPRAQQDGVILIDTLNCDDAIARLPENIFCIAKTTEHLGIKLAEILLEDKVCSPAVIYFDGDPFMGVVQQSLTDTLKERGAGTASIDTYNDSSLDFRSILLKIRNAKKARSLVLLGYDQLGLAIKQAREIGLIIPVYGVNTATSPGFQALSGNAAEGMVAAAFHAPRTPEYRTFETKFIQKIGRPPQFETSAIPSYDAVHLLLNALRDVEATGKADTSQSIAALRTKLLETKNYNGLSGTITIDPDGATRALKVIPMVLKGGELLVR